MAYLGNTIINGNLKAVNGIQTTTLNGVAVGSSPKFTDTVYTHPNTVTAGTVGTSSATSGSTLAVPYVTYNANGHITVTGTHTHTVTGFAASSHTHNYAGSSSAGGAATTANALNNYYGSRQASANTTFGDGKLRIYMATSSMTTGKPPSDASMLHLAWDNTGKWDGQIAVSTSGSNLYVRSNNGSETWGSWRTVLFTDSSLNAAKLTGTVPSSCYTNSNTTNTAGSTNTTSKIFLIGATSQAASPQTYSNSACYVTNGAFYSTSISTGGNIVAGGTSGTNYIQTPSGIKLY